MYEHRTQRPLSRHHFARRMVGQLGYAVAVLVPSLGLGTVVFRYIVRQSWHLAFLNSAMLLSGMGPVGDLDGGTSGSVAAAFFALYAGLVFIVVTGLILAPIVHRVLHRLHYQEEDVGRRS
jgi:predicted membrane-bound spermidine synthase